MTFLSAFSSRAGRPRKPPFARASRRRRHLAALVAGGATLLAATTAGAQPLVYYGGRVISNVEIVQVAWTSGVDAVFLQDLATFHQTLLQTGYLDWLTEYDTIGKTGAVDGMPGSGQHIGRGTFGGSFVISPANAKTSLQDSEIGAELVAQIKSGALPALKLDAGGNVNSLYMIEFPAAYTINLYGLQSCAQFGGYHSTVLSDGKSVPYAVIPDCGYDFATDTFVDTHELVEAITDAEAGLLVDPYLPTNRPIAWVAAANNFWEAPECADICQNVTDQIAGYTVATNWSNFAGGCVAQIPVCDGSAAPPACRPCNAFDSGAACNGTTPACATAGPKAGQCVLCTAAAAGACTGATPTCDEATYTCVGCLQNADCQDPNTPFCEAASKTCRPCQADDECATGHCDFLDDGHEGQCVACNADADCEADNTCQDHACVANPVDTTTGGSGGSGGGGSGGSGSGAPGADPGCSCRTGPGNSGPDASWAVAGAALATLLRRRRREQPLSSHRREGAGHPS